MAEFSRAPVCRFNQLARAFDVPELPGRQGKEGHRYSADAVAKTFQHLQIPLGLAGGERLLAVGPRLGEIPGKVGDQGKAAVNDASFHDAPGLLRFPKERQCLLARRT